MGSSPAGVPHFIQKLNRCSHEEGCLAMRPGALSVSVSREESPAIQTGVGYFMSSGGKGINGSSLMEEGFPGAHSSGDAALHGRESLGCEKREACGALCHMSQYVQD